MSESPEKLLRRRPTKKRTLEPSREVTIKQSPKKGTSRRISPPPSPPVLSNVLSTALAASNKNRYIQKHLPPFEINRISSGTTNGATLDSKKKREKMIKMREERNIPFAQSLTELNKDEHAVLDRYDISELPQLIYEHYPTQMSEDTVEEVTIEEITVLILTHGTIHMTILPETNFDDINKLDEEELTGLIPTYSAREVFSRVNRHTFNFPTYFSCEFDTVDYKGNFTNVSSCAGVPTIQLPFASIDTQKYVNAEESAMKISSKNEDNFPRKQVWGLCTEELIEEMNFSHSFCEGMSRVSKNCFNLIQHSETICNSLLIKSYFSKIDEVSKFDCGKIIMFIKVKDKNDDISIKKFVLLGPEMDESMNAFNIMFQERFNDAIQEYLHTCRRNEEGVRTYTINIITLINKINEVFPVPVKLFDKSCNTVSNNNTSFRIPIIIRPNTPLFVMFSLINAQISNMQHKCKIAVFGGKRKSRRIKRKLKSKN